MYKRYFYDTLRDWEQYDFDDNQQSWSFQSDAIATALGDITNHDNVLVVHDMEEVHVIVWQGQVWKPQ